MVAEFGVAVSDQHGDIQSFPRCAGQGFGQQPEVAPAALRVTLGQLVDAGSDPAPSDVFDTYTRSSVPGGRAPHAWLDDAHGVNSSLSTGSVRDSRCCGGVRTQLVRRRSARRQGHAVGAVHIYIMQLRRSLGAFDAPGLSPTGTATK